MKTTINITTKDWYAIISELQNRGWKATRQYEGFDAGIDYDSCVLKKGSERIRCTWDNYTEGEFRCSDEVLEELRSIFQRDFECQ